MRLLISSCVLLLLAGFTWADPSDAVVRIISHGASATVIQTEQGRTWLLGCAHAYRGKDRTKPMAIDAPSPRSGAVRTGGIRLVKVDYDLDLSLVEMGVGPLPYVCPVAPQGHRPGRLLSVGYDEMKTPPVKTRVNLHSLQGRLTFTYEKPWHGRSGGALIDSDRGWLVGVVMAYETRPGGRGMYASHTAILQFLRGVRSGDSLTPSPAPPRFYEGELDDPAPPRFYEQHTPGPL